jgi:hypothetical protein
VFHFEPKDHAVQEWSGESRSLFFSMTSGISPRE